jgi:hypothetical protein
MKVPEISHRPAPEFEGFSPDCLLHMALFAVAFPRGKAASLLGLRREQLENR